MARYTPLPIIAALLLSLGPTPAQASVNVGQILVKTTDGDALDAAIRQYLEGWAGRSDARQTAWFDVEAQGRRVVVLPPRDGWALVTEATEVTADPALAEVISRALDTRVLWLEMMGGALSWRYAVLEKGKIVSTHAEPQPGYGGFPIEGAMPTYRDVEPLGWALLAEEGVPRAYRYVGQTDVEVAKDPKAGPQATIFKVVAGKEGLKVGQGAFGFTLPDRGRTSPTPMGAVLPTDLGAPEGGASGEMAVDLVRVTGTPEPEAVDNLVSVLGRIQTRYMKGSDVRFCQLVPDRYRLPVYSRLASRKGPCQVAYGKLLAKAKADAAAPEGTVPKPPPRTPKGR